MAYENITDVGYTHSIHSYNYFNIFKKSPRMIQVGLQSDAGRLFRLSADREHLKNKIQGVVESFLDDVSIEEIDAIATYADVTGENPMVDMGNYIDDQLSLFDSTAIAVMQLRPTAMELAAMFQNVRMRMMQVLQEYLHNTAFVPVLSGKLRDTTQLQSETDGWSVVHTVPYAWKVVKFEVGVPWLVMKYREIIQSEIDMLGVTI